jgi:hypothetical protein
MGVVYGLPKAPDGRLQLGIRTGLGLVPHPPHWLMRGWVACETRDDVPMKVGDLVAQELVVDLPGFIGQRDGFGDEAHFLDQLVSLRWSQVKQFRRMMLKDDHRPAGEKLVVVEKDF